MHIEGKCLRESNSNSDSFVKSPSAALRFTPQFLRALHLELFTRSAILIHDDSEHLRSRGDW